MRIIFCCDSNGPQRYILSNLYNWRADAALINRGGPGLDCSLGGNFIWIEFMLRAFQCILLTQFDCAKNTDIAVIKYLIISIVKQYHN